MRGIKEYLTLTKNNTVIKLIIGSEIKHYPIISISYEFKYNQSRISIIANASNLEYKMRQAICFNNNEKFDIYYGNYKYLRCSLIRYTKLDSDNLYELQLVVEQLSIN
jgi:hypothetical protein